MKFHFLSPVVLFLFACIFINHQADAQLAGGFNALFIVQPYPSPYFSDWQNNPSITSLTINNPLSGQQRVIISLIITTVDGRQVVSGTSDPIPLLAGPNVFNNTTMLHGNLTYYNTGLKSQIAQTGRIPEGTYTACVTVKNIDGATLVQSTCANFTIVYPDPPHLVFPANEDSVTTTYPIFQWTPIQVPVQYQLHYVLRIAEILQGQTPAQALAADVPQYLNDNLMTTTLQYPISGLPLKSGSTYVWQVQALDQNGFPPASNNGQSEIWVFTYQKPTLVALHPVYIPPSPPIPPIHFVFLTNSSVTGNLHGTFSQPNALAGIFGKSSSWKPDFLLANMTIELVAKYMLVQGNLDHVTPLTQPVESSVSRDELPSDPRYNDADQTVATTTTDGSGNFSFSFLQTDSTGLIATNQTITFARWEGGSNSQTGNLYKFYRIIVQSPYYLSPSTDIMVQPNQSDNVGSLPAMVRKYNLTINVMPTTVQGGHQITQGPLADVDVYILRQSRPLGVPDSEGYPGPQSPQTIQGMQVVAQGLTDVNGNVTFSDLVQNIGPNDQYFLYAVPDPGSGLNYFCFANSFQFSASMVGFGKTPNFSVTPSNFSNASTFNNEYLVPTVSTKMTMFPMLPRIAGTVYRKDNQTVPVSGAQVQLLDYAVIFWANEATAYTGSDGSFSFDNLNPVYDANGDITGPIRALTISKYGFNDLNVDINNAAPLKLGQSVPVGKRLLAPAASVTGKVVDEQGNPVEANVTVGAGATVVANQTITIAGKSNGIGGTGHRTIISNTGFQCAAILGSQQIAIDPVDQSFFIDSETVNITQDGQDLGTFVLKKKMHRILVQVTTPGKEVIGGSEVRGTHVKLQNVQNPIFGAHVAIQSLSGDPFGNLITDMNGNADTMFVSGNNSFTIVVTAPDNSDYVGQTVTANIPNSKDWTIIDVSLQKASHVSGKVFAGNTPIPGAHVFLDQSRSPNASPVETYSDSNGRYVLHNLPIGSSLTIDAAKSQSNYIGDSKKIKVSRTGNDTLNFNLRVYNGMNITRLMGFPIEVTSLSENGSAVSISGNIVSLPSNKVFSPLDSTAKVPFHDISIIAGSQRDSNGVPYAIPQKLPMITDANSISLKIYGTMAGAQTDNEAGIGITDAGNGVGEFADFTYIDAASFTSDPAFSNIKFPNDQLFLALPGQANTSKNLSVPVIVASGATPASIQNGLLVSDDKGNSLHYTLYGFVAVADSSSSMAEGDTVRLRTTIHSDLTNVSNPDIDFDVGNVVLHSKKFDAIQGRDTLTIAIEKWQLEGSQWSISQSGGLMLNEGQLVTGTVDVPFSGIHITPTDLKYGSFQVNSMSLGGILPLSITGSVQFGFDTGKQHWTISVGPKGGSNSAAYIGNLPGTAVTDKVSINNFYLLSDGSSGFTIDNTSPGMTYYKVAAFTPTSLSVYPTNVHIPGTMDVHLPGLQAQSCAIDYSKTGGVLTSNLETFPFSFDAAGVHLEFPADQSHPETLDSKGFYAEGTVSEEGKFSFNVRLYRTPDSTSIWTIPGQSLNIAANGATSLTSIAGSMNVSNNAWNNFWFAGNMTGTNGASGRVTFVDYGDIVANNQQLGVKNIDTPFGNLTFTYDFQRHVLEGYLQIDKDLAGGAHVSGAADAVVDIDGWYFVAGASLKLTNPHANGNAAIVFGDHPMSDSIVTIVKQYSWVYQKKGSLPSEFPSTVSGFYFEGEMDLPVPVIPSFDFNFGLVSAKLWANIGGDVRLAMTFASDGNTYATGIDIFADVGAGIGASVVVACAGLDAEVLADVALDGQYQSNGNWYVDGSATLTLSGTTYCGFGVCDANCGGMCDKQSESASVTVGVNGHYGTDYQQVSFVLKGGI